MSDYLTREHVYYLVRRIDGRLAVHDTLGYIIRDESGAVATVYAARADAIETAERIVRLLNEDERDRARAGEER